MSVFLVSDDHINKILSVLDKSFYKKGIIQKFGKILREQNMRSVNNRYKESTEAPQFVFSEVSRPEPIQALKYCDFLEYQSSDTLDYKTTDAYTIIQEIRNTAIKLLPGYEEAEWSAE